MCRNITILRGLEPPATPQEIDDAARQFLRKVTGFSSPSHIARDDVHAAVAEVSRVVAQLLASLPPRRATVVRSTPRRPTSPRDATDDGCRALRNTNI
jgi:hypothetical protein